MWRKLHILCNLLGWYTAFSRQLNDHSSQSEITPEQMDGTLIAILVFYFRLCNSNHIIWFQYVKQRSQRFHHRSNPTYNQAIHIPVICNIGMQKWVWPAICCCQWQRFSTLRTYDISLPFLYSCLYSSSQYACVYALDEKRKTNKILNVTTFIYGQQTYQYSSSIQQHVK